MQYDDSRLLYDQTNVDYEGRWAIDISDTAKTSESKTQVIEKVITEAASSTEVIVKNIATKVLEVVAVSESNAREIQKLISEIVGATESIEKFISLRVISDGVKASESFVKMVNVVILDRIKASEKLIKWTSEKFKGVIRIAKEFIKNSISVEQIQVKATGDKKVVENEIINDPSIQYDESSIQYNDSDIHYNNYLDIVSGSPTIKIKNVKKQVSIENSKPVVRYEK